MRAEKNVKKSCFYTFNFTAYNSSTYLDLSMGLRFDICFKHALEFRLCAIFSLYSPHPSTALFPLQVEKVRKIGKNAPHTYEACVHACVFAQ